MSRVANKQLSVGELKCNNCNVGRGYFVHGAILVFVAKIIICEEIGTS